MSSPTCSSSDLSNSSDNTLEIAAVVSNLNLGNKPLEVSTDVESVRFDDTTIYVICVNGEALSYTHSAETVVRVMEVIVREECKRLQQERDASGKRYEMAVRKDKDDGTKFTITEKAMGWLYDGSVVDHTVFTAYPISHARINKRRVILTTTDVPVMSSVLITNDDQVFE